VLDEVEQRGLGPVDVLEDDDQRSRSGAALEIPTQSPAELFGDISGGDVLHDVLRAREPRQHADALAHDVGIRVIAECSLHRGIELGQRRFRGVAVVDAGVRANDERQRIERDRIAVRQAAATADSRMPERGDELVDQA